MNKKKIIRAAIVLSSISLLLFVVLIVHIAMVTNPKEKPHFGIQLSRIDFKTPLDSAQAAEIESCVRSIKGVGSTMYSYEHNNLVFAHQLGIVSGQEVFDQLMAQKDIAAERFSLTPEQMALTAKCPVMKEQSILMTLAHKVQQNFL